MNDDDDLCDICKKPMLDGQGLYAGIRHWDCQYPEGYKSSKQLSDEINAAADKAISALQRARRKLS